MKKNNLDNTIIFIDKKIEYSDHNQFHNLNLNRLNRLKNSKIIGYKNHKKLKMKQAKKEAIKNSKLYKYRKIILVFLILILSSYLFTFLWNSFKKPTYTKSSNNQFKVESQYLSSIESSTYTSIIEKSIKDTLGINYEINIKNLHKNGDLVFGNGFFNIPNKGHVNFDIILKNHSPYSLKVNGKEYF